MDDNNVFEGFRAPEEMHFYHVPNEWTDITSEIDNLAELKVIEYIMRHTWGFKEYDQFKQITTDEFMHGRKKRDGTRMDKGTGLSKHSVIDGLRNAIKHGYVLEEVDDTDKGRVVKSYALKMLKTDENSCAESAPQECKDFTPDVNNLHTSSEESSHRTEKETPGKKKKKEREKERLTHSLALPDFCLEKLTQVAKICGEDVGQHVAEAERIYQQSGKSGDEFCDLLFGIEALIKMYGPRTMDEFLRLLRENVGRKP